MSLFEFIHELHVHGSSQNFETGVSDFSSFSLKSSNEKTFSTTAGRSEENRSVKLRTRQEGPKLERKPSS